MARVLVFFVVLSGMMVFVSPRAYAADQGRGFYVFAGTSYFLTDNADGQLKSILPDYEIETAQFDHSDKAALDFGVGYQLNSKFSIDLAGTLVRGIKLSGAYLLDGVEVENSVVTSSIDSFYLFTDLYWTFWSDKKETLGIVPYLGAGVGLGRHKVDAVKFWSGDSLDGAQHTTFAYKLSAGVKEVFDEIAIDIRYSFVDGGTAESGLSGNDGTASFSDPMKIDIKSHVLSVDFSYLF